MINQCLSLIYFDFFKLNKNYNETLTCTNCGYVYKIGTPLCPKCGN